MKPTCPQKCAKSPTSGRVIKYGSYYRTSDRRKIQRYQCALCGMNFSHATGTPEFGQNKRQLNPLILKALASKASQNQLAHNLNTTQKTIAKKLKFLGEQLRHKNYVMRRKRKKVLSFQFDEMETFEHTKLKPLSIALAVEEESRYIIGVEVSRMPAKGLLAAKSVKKYGRRKDERPEAIDRLFRRITPVVEETAKIVSDSNPHYRQHIQKHFPLARYETIKGARGAVTGQGELKKVVFDPIFSLNHTCAMFRDRVSRLLRRNWCTTKSLQPLMDHLEIYIYFHNQKLIGGY